MEDSLVLYFGIRRSKIMQLTWQQTIRPVCIYLPQQTSRQQSTSINAMTMAPKIGASTTHKQELNENINFGALLRDSTHQLTRRYSRPIVEPPIIEIIEIPIIYALSSVA